MRAIVLALCVGLTASLAAMPALACTQETADRLAATDTQARRDADLMARAEIVGLAVLTGVQGEIYAFSFGQTLRGAPPSEFQSESMVVISCRYGDMSWRLDRLRVGERVLVLGGTNADGSFNPEYVMPARGRPARRLLTLIDQGAAQ
jgi:hypothetical protein